MCQSIIIDGFYTGQVAQLAEKIGCAPAELVWVDDADPDYLVAIGEADFRICLCGINLAATAEKFGYDHSYDDFGDSILTKRG